MQRARARVDISRREYVPRVLALRGASLSRWLKQDQAGVSIVSVYLRMLASLTHGGLTLDNLSLYNLLNVDDALFKRDPSDLCIYYTFLVDFVYI